MEKLNALKSKIDTIMNVDKAKTELQRHLLAYLFTVNEASHLKIFGWRYPIPKICLRKIKNQSHITQLTTID